jgi:hypothetical protein
MAGVRLVDKSGEDRCVQQSSGCARAHTSAKKDGMLSAMASARVITDGKVIDMLRITIQPTSHGTTLLVEGHLGSPWVQQLERLWERVRDHALHHAVRIDLTSVLFVDAEGTRILKQMHNDGAELTSEEFQTKSLVEDVTGLKMATEGSKRRRNRKVRRKRVMRHVQHSTP